MKLFETVNEILDFAISMEATSESLYLDYAKGTKDENIRRTFERLANVERGHQEDIYKIKGKLDFDKKESWIKKLNIGKKSAENLTLPPSTNYFEILTFCIEKEKASADLYSRLAEDTQDTELKNLLKKLSIEEEEHILCFEKKIEEISN